jgi:hypothetical protein
MTEEKKLPSAKYKYLLLTKNYAKALAFIEREGLEEHISDLYIGTGLGVSGIEQPVQKLDTLASLATKELLHEEFSFVNHKGKKYKTIMEQPTLIYAQAKILAKELVNEYEKYRSIKYFDLSIPEQRVLENGAQHIRRKLYFLEQEHIPHGMFPCEKKGFFNIHKELNKRDKFFTYGPSIVAKTKLLAEELRHTTKEAYERAEEFRIVHDEFEIYPVEIRKPEYSTKR